MLSLSDILSLSRLYKRFYFFSRVAREPVSAPGEPKMTGQVVEDGVWLLATLATLALAGQMYSKKKL